MPTPKQKVILYQGQGVKSVHDARRASVDKYRLKNEQSAPCPECGRMMKVGGSKQPHRMKSPNQWMKCPGSVDNSPSNP